jgi:hypothetical protein
MAYHRLGNAADEQTVESSSPVRSDHDEIGRPLTGGLDDRVSRIGIGRNHARMEPHELELLRNPLDQLTRTREALATRNRSMTA